MSAGIMQKSPDSILWQDYRAANTGMIVYYSSDPVSEIPIREIPDDADSPVVPEPNYESGTYGFYGCSRTKIRGAFAKSKIRYMFFLTKYAGTKDGFKDKMLITGYYHIAKTADVQKLHLRYLNEYSCIDSATCIALRADEVVFVALEDAFEVSPDRLKEWGFNAKVSKQLRIILTPESTSELLTYLKSKPNKLDSYVAETRRLSPYDEAIAQDAEEDVSADAAQEQLSSAQEIQESARETMLTDQQQGALLPESMPAPPTDSPPQEPIPPGTD
jgi:hypothetical protein